MGSIINLREKIRVLSVPGPGYPEWVLGTLEIRIGISGDTKKGEPPSYKETGNLRKVKKQRIG